MMVLTVDGSVLYLTRKKVTVKDVGSDLYSVDSSGTIPLIDRAIPEILSEISDTLKSIETQL